MKGVTDIETQEQRIIRLADSKTPVNFGTELKLAAYRAIGLAMQDEDGYGKDHRAGAATPAAMVLDDFITDRAAVLKRFPFVKKYPYVMEALEKVWTIKK